MSKRIKTIEQIVSWRLCLGCGACAYICPEKRISLVDVLDEGIRPVLECGVRNAECGMGVGDVQGGARNAECGIEVGSAGASPHPSERGVRNAECGMGAGDGQGGVRSAERGTKVADLHSALRTAHSALEPCLDCTACLEVCPAYENDHTEINSRPDLIPELKEACGPVLEVWEGHAADPEIRFLGSSGGLITALSLFCLEKRGMHGVLHIGGDPKDPLRNQTTMSRTRGELLRKTGSRYAPASACDRLDLIESAPAPCVFVGQPTEVTALKKAERLKPALGQKVGLTISFFCAGSPAARGTRDFLESKGIDPDHVQELRYRGKGWPGNFSVTLKGQSSPAFQTTYKESWGFVQAYRPFSVHLCPDGTGEDADISCGDPWYREVQEGEPGSSLVVVRTERGRQIIREAISSGYVSLQPATAQKVVDSQRNLLAKRGAIWGRTTILRLLGLPAPRLRGFHLFKNWRQLPINDKLRSTLGTARRIIARRYYRTLNLDTMVIRNHKGALRNDEHPSSPTNNKVAARSLVKGK